MSEQTDLQTGASIPQPTLSVGQHQYFTVQQLAEIFDVPAYHFIARVRAGDLHGQKIGKQYVVSAEEFHKWIVSGNFNYRKRKKEANS